MLISVYKRYKQKGKKGGFVWYANIRIRVGKGQSSRRLRESIPGVTTEYDAKQEAQKIAQRFYDEIFNPTEDRPKDKPLADFVRDDFIPWAEEHKKQPRHYRVVTRTWLELPSLKGKSVRQVTQFDIEAAKIIRRKTVSRYGEKVLPQTVNGELIIMSSLFHRAVEWGYHDMNPCKGITKLPAQPEPPRALTAKEAQALLKAAWEGPGYLPYLIIVGLGTGLRQKEMRLLKKTDVDLGQGLLFVNDPKWKDDPRRTKGVPLNSEVKHCLARWMAETQSEWVFPSPTNQRKPLAQPTGNKSLTYACERAEIESIGFHALRHTFGTRLAEAGVRLEIIKDLMGHSKVATTLIYVHPSREAARDAVEQVLVTSWSQGKSAR